jgi:hypothetical protein
VVNLVKSDSDNHLQETTSYESHIEKKKVRLWEGAYKVTKTRW